MDIAGVLAGLGVFLVILGALCILMISSMWKVFTKAGKPGWACIVPIYNMMVLAEIGGKPNWWGLLVMIPLAGLIVAIIIYIDVAKAFGKGAGFGVCLFLFAPICWPMLGFGSAQYVGSGGGAQPNYAPQP